MLLLYNQMHKNCQIRGYCKTGLFEFVVDATTVLIDALNNIMYVGSSPMFSCGVTKCDGRIWYNEASINIFHNSV